jgi:hypothetical protein
MQMGSRLRIIGIAFLSILLVGTAAAQSNLGWTWNQKLVLPSEHGEGADASSQSRESFVRFSSSSFGDQYGTWDAVSSTSMLLPAGMPATGAPGDDRPLTWGDLQRYHEQVVMPLQRSLQQSNIPSVLPHTGEVPGTYAPPAGMQQSAEGPCGTEEEGQIRNAADECNVCMCRSGSWMCTHYACTGENEWRACAANSDCAVHEVCSTSRGDCNQDCRRGMQACGPGICGGMCIPAGEGAPQCGDGRCDEGEANICTACNGDACTSAPCFQGTCPADCRQRSI